MNRRSFLATLAAVPLLVKPAVAFVIQPIKGIYIRRPLDLGSQIVPIDRLSLWEYTRQPNPWFLDQLIESIQEQGVLTPLWVDTKGMILDGDHRYHAAKACGLTHVPVNVIDEMSPGALEFNQLLKHYGKPCAPPIGLG